MRGLFSATVPNSSLAGVRRVLVPHMEDEKIRRMKSKMREKMESKE